MSTRSRLSCWAVLVLMAMAPAAALAQPVASQASKFALSPQLSSLPPDETEKPPDPEPETKAVPLKIFRLEAEPDVAAPDPVVQDEAPPAIVSPPALSFAGLSSADNQTAFGSQVLPPDTVGDVGPNHYVQMTNLMFRVFDKAGNPLAAPLKVSSIFAPLGAPCGSRDDGDPIVLYDPLADRWMLSQFCTVADPFNHQVIAISKTPDPSGAWYLYDFAMPNNKFNDYPKFGVWTDAYYMTDNQFNQAGTAFLGAGVFAFDRARMLAGDPTAGLMRAGSGAAPGPARCAGTGTPPLISTAASQPSETYQLHPRTGPRCRG